MDFLKNIKQFNFPSKNYIQEKHPKKQIYLHHTAGGPNGESVYRWWIQSPPRVATCVVISRDGTIIQGFSSQYWAYHLGLSNRHFTQHGLRYQNLDRISIGIEICNWGQLTYKNNKFYNYVGGVVPENEVYELNTPYRKYKFYQNYTREQIESVRNLLLYWNDFYSIPLNYNDDVWNINLKALRGEEGIYTHGSVRPDKVDIYPHLPMINMLNSLEKSI